LANRADLSLLEPWIAPWQLSVRTSSPRPSGYASASDFVKEFAPDQVLRSDNLLGGGARGSAASGEPSEGDREGGVWFYSGVPVYRLIAM